MFRYYIYKFFSLYIAFIIILLFFLLGSISFLSLKTNNLKNEIILEIPKNTSLKNIAEILFDNNVINNKFIFISYSFLIRKSYSLKAGEYLFESSDNNKSIIKKLFNNEIHLYKIIIPECFSNVQIYKKLNSSILVLDKIYEEYEEGDFFPDTYFYSKDTKKSEILKRMNNLANSKFAEAISDLNNSLKMKLNKNEILILASLVEAEAKIKKEKKKIASVFLNRIKVGMKLQSDPTIIYGINKKAYMDRPITKKDILLDHPWNTYKIIGLPPTPICNVGYDSIKAVLNPDKTEYLYFVADGKGGHFFSKTYEEHQNFIKILRKNSKID